MRLASGWTIDKPREALLGFVRLCHPCYDGVSIKQDDQLHVTDIALSIMMNSQISGNTGSAIWLARGPVEAALARIPASADLLDVPADDPIPGAEGIEAAVTSMCRIRRAKLAVSTKILHKKRPRLIPILDSVVEAH